LALNTKVIADVTIQLIYPFLSPLLLCGKADVLDETPTATNFTIMFTFNMHFAVKQKGPSLHRNRNFSKLVRASGDMESGLFDIFIKR
jgi:hypothetical protein